MQAQGPRRARALRERDGADAWHPDRQLGRSGIGVRKMAGARQATAVRVARAGTWLVAGIGVTQVQRLRSGGRGEEGERQKDVAGGRHRARIWAWWCSAPVWQGAFRAATRDGPALSDKPRAEPPDSLVCTSVPAVYKLRLHYIYCTLAKGLIGSSICWAEFVAPGK